MLIWSIFLLIFSIAGLELYTRNCHCSVPVATSTQEMHFSISICEQDIGSYPFSYDLEQQQLIDEIIEKRNKGERIDKEEYRSAMDLLVYEAPPEYLEGVNGVVCRGRVAFVRDSLPEQAKNFVARHELEHLFQTTHENQEIRANIAAGKEYPMGLISTIILSLAEAKSQLPWCCFLKSSWFAFKLYFLGMDGA